MYLKEIVLTTEKSLLYFGIFNNKKFIALQSDKNFFKYIYTPAYFFFEKRGSILFIKSRKNDINLNIFELFFNQLNNFLININKVFKQKLILKGLGYRINLNIDDQRKTYLSMKIGFSHLINICIPTKKVSIFLKKAAITLKGFDSVFIGNLSKKIKNCKLTNAYTGKGFWYQNQTIKYKFFKKK